MVAFTPNLNLAKPAVDGDDDVWGAMLNGNADILDTVFNPLMIKATGTPDARSVQDRFADELNVLDFFPGTYTSGTDITDALQAALATGKNVWMPAGYVYRIKRQIVVGVSGNSHQSQRLRGDGKSTYIIIEANFDPLADCIIKLKGVETNGPTICDFRITCAQPSAANNRADFVVLGTPGAGNGMLGVKYPPVVGFVGGECNRFRIERMRFANCWDGIHQLGTNASGGWWIRDIEISPLNIGLKVEHTLDSCHISGWHHWFFEQTVANQVVMRDGQSFCMTIGDAGQQSQSINIEELNNFYGRIRINTYGTTVFMNNVFMDTGNCCIEVVDCMWVQIANIHFSVESTGPSSGLPNISVAGVGHVHISNIVGWIGLQPWVKQTSGALLITNGMLSCSVRDVPFVQQSAGTLMLSNLDIRFVGGVWTTIPFQCTGGTFSLTDSYVSTPSTGDNGLISITNDSISQQVSGVRLNGWKFTPPGPLGDYQTGGNFYTKAVVAGGATFGSATAAQAGLTLHATGQKTINVYNNNAIRWAFGATNTDDFAILRYNDAGVLQPNTLGINRLTGVLQLSFGGNVVTYGVNPTDMPAQNGWRALGIQGVTGIAPAIDLINTSDNTTTNILFRRSRGTPTALTAITTSDALGNINFMGYDGTTWVSNSALIRVTATAPWTASVRDTQMAFYATTGITLNIPLTLSGTTAQFNVPITTGASATYGNQVKLGATGQGGRVDFARGSDGVMAGWVGMASATGTAAALVAGGGSPLVIIDAQNTAGTVSLRTNATERLGVTDTAVTATVAITAPNHRVGSNQIIGARVTGWGAATGGSKVAFNGATATLPQTSAALAQLIADLTTHGLIGA